MIKNDKENDKNKDYSIIISQWSKFNQLITHFLVEKNKSIWNIIINSSMREKICTLITINIEKWHT